MMEGGWGGLGWLTLGLLQVSSEQAHLERFQRVGDEGLLLLRGDGVDGVEAEAEQARGGGVADKGRRHEGGRLDGLLEHVDAADADGVEVHVARRAAAVAVVDRPRVVVQLGGRAALLDLVQLLAALLVGGGLGAEHPQVRGARVEVEHQRLRRRADLNWGQILDVEELGSGGDLAYEKCERAMKLG